MYQCKTEPILGHVPKVIVSKGKSLLKKWIDESPKDRGLRPFIWAPWDRSLSIYLDRVKGHIDKKDFKKQTPRYRFVPCAKELLEKGSDKPVFMDERNNQKKWGLMGLTPQGMSFIVIISEFITGKNEGEFFLNTFYPTKK